MNHTGTNQPTVLATLTEGMLLVVARMIRVLCNAVKGKFIVFGGRCQHLMAKTFIRFFIIGMNRDVVGSANVALEVSQRSLCTGRVHKHE